MYGEDVFDRFYAWLGNNEYRFAHATAADLREAEKLIPYPAFGSWNDWRIIDHFGATYKDTYVDLEAGKQYLQAYKGKDISNLKLYVDPYNLLTGNIQPVTIEFYDANGYLLRTDSCITQTEFDLTGVSLLRLVGENTAKEIKVIDNVIGLK